MAGDLRDVRPGDALEPGHLNRAYAELRRLRSMRTGGRLELLNAEGDAPPVLAPSLGERVDIRLTGPFAAGYPWAEVLLAAAGTWVPTGRAGGPGQGDPAFERRVGDVTLTADGTVYHAVRSAASNQLVFPRRNPTTPHGGHPLQGCPCALVPDALSLRVDPDTTSGRNQLFPASINYGAKPSDLFAYVIDDPGWYSGAKFTSADGFYKYRYYFTCRSFAGDYDLYIVTTPDSPLDFPAIGLVQSWLIDDVANFCSPFSLTYPDPTRRHLKIVQA